MKTSAAFCVGLGLLFAGAADAQTAWTQYSSPQGHYRVSFPKKPTVIVAGNAVQASFESAAFQVTYYDLTASDPSATQTTSLERARDRMLTQLHATVVRETSVRLGLVPGTQLLLSATSPSGLQWVESARIYVVGSRVYDLLCMFPKTSETPAIVTSASTFLGSFEVESAE